MAESKICSSDFIYLDFGLTGKVTPAVFDTSPYSSTEYNLITCILKQSQRSTIVPDYAVSAVTWNNFSLIIDKTAATNYNDWRATIIIKKK